MTRAFALAAALASSSAQGSGVQYAITGDAQGSNGLAATLRDLAGFTTNGSGGVPVGAQLVLDTAAPSFAYTNTAQFRQLYYAGAVQSMSINVGGFQFGNQRGFFDDPAAASTALGDEAQLFVEGAPATGMSRFRLEADDRSPQGEPVPGTPLFNAHNRPVDVVLNGVYFNLITFRITSVDLFAGGIVPGLPIGIPTEPNWADGANVLLTGFYVGFGVALSGPNGAAAGGNTLYFLANPLTLVASPVPEPSALLLALAGLAAISYRARRARPAQTA